MSLSRFARLLTGTVVAALVLTLGGAAPSVATAAAYKSSSVGSASTSALQFVPACVNCQQGSIVNDAHNLCLDANESGDGTNGDKVQLWACTGKDNQTWHQFANNGSGPIINNAHNLCLDANESGDGTNGDKVQLWACTGKSNQSWGGLCGNFTWCNAAHMLCLDANESGDGTNGDKVQLWACNGRSNQHWNSFVP